MKGVIKEVGRYIVGEVVGQGSFGKVYKGVDRFDKTEVALKFITKRGKNKKELEGLRSQNQMLKKISHKNIIKLLDFLETQNEVIIITEFAGQNLSDVLQRKKKFTYQEVKSYCRQILDALCYLDENRIAHRDLKPQNILIQNQVIKICDFGFARKLSASTTFMNSLKGTPLYIAPEILATGPLNYTKKVDVWSFGIIIYELYAGRPPFWAENLAKLKPKILYEKVRFPKDMPIELRTLIDKMLQKIPEARADWQVLKKEPFFIEALPLKDISQNVQNVKNIQALKQEYIKGEQPSYLLKKESDKDSSPLPSKNEKQKLVSNLEVEEIRKIQADLQGSKVEGKKLRTDFIFLEKIINLYGSYFAGQLIVSKEIMTTITTIFIFLLSKVKPSEISPQQDITKRKQLLFCAIKLAQQDTDSQTLPNELLMIGFLIKNNFENVSVDFQTDQDILEICIREIQACRTLSCFGNALTILGTLASQALVTLSHSQQFFVKVEEQKIVAAIAQTYEPLPSKKIVLDCLQKFIHSNIASVTLQKNQHSLKKIFTNMKLQAASTLLQKKFLIYNPITIYKDISHVESYAKILYECINVSDEFRKQFLKNTYWTDFLQHKNLKIYCLAYDIICIQKDKTCLISNEIMKNIAMTEKKNSTLEKLLYFARAEFYLSKKQTQTSNKQESTLKILNQICELVKIDEDAKKKANREVESFICTGQRIFEQVIAQTFCNILNDPAFDKLVIVQETIPVILQNLFNFKLEDQLRVSPMTASKILIVIEELSKAEFLIPKQQKRIFLIIANLITYFLQNGIIYQLQSQQGPAHTKKLLISIFNSFKIISSFDQKLYFNLCVLAEEKGLHNLLVSDNILDKTTLSLCLTLLHRLIMQSKFINTIVDFVGLNLIGKLKPYLKLDLEDKDSEVIVQIIHIISLIIKKNEDYASKIKQLDIISHFNRYLQHPHNEQMRHQTLTLIGNMAKHSPYFFDDFANHDIFRCIVETLKRFGQGSKCKILKGIVYAVGNVSFYTDKFSKDFTQLIPSFYTALSIDDPYLVSNTMSTISNLLRHSNCYLKALVQHKIFKKVIQIINEVNNPQQNRLTFGLNMIKKLLVYPQIFQDIPKSQFISIYTHKVKIVGQDNECMKKIKSLIS